MLKLILNYGTQKSTYTGLFSVLAAFGIVLKPALSDAIVACALGIIGLINVVADEHKNKK